MGTEPVPETLHLNKLTRLKAREDYIEYFSKPDEPKIANLPSLNSMNLEESVNGAEASHLQKC
jgi:hypothetical protein